MIYLPTAVVVLMALALVFYCAERVLKIGSWLINMSQTHHIEQLEKLHDTTYREIQTGFDLWWSGNPSHIVRQKVIESTLLPDEVRESMPPDEFEKMIMSIAGPVIKGCKEAAFHLAVHARLAAEEDRLINRLPRLFKFRERVARKRTDHEEVLALSRNELLEIGIDVDELEKYFASAS